MGRSSKQKVNKETRALNNTLDKLALTDIFRIFYPKTETYTFFSRVHEIFSKIDHILGHKTSLNKFKILKSHHAYVLTTCYQTRNPSQEMIWKEHKYVEVK